MCAHERSDKSSQVLSDAYYEEQANQEEVYLEETEEELRFILESDDPSPALGENLNERREHAAEELITDDADDAPLSDEEVEQMLESVSNVQRLKRT